MTISNQCKWISFFVMSLAVVLLLLLFYSWENQNKCRCKNKGEFMLKETGECYQHMTQGPCHHNLVFMEDEPHGTYGSCNCPYMSFNRSMLYKGGTCFFIFTQAFCSDGHWLNVSQKGEPICEQNYCLQHSRNELDLESNGNDDAEDDMKSADQFDGALNKTNRHGDNGIVEWVPIKGGMCVQLGKTMKGCPKGAVVRFHRNYIYPSCFEPLYLSIGAIGVGPYSSCPLGSYRSIMGKCQPTFDFDFDSSAQPDESSTDSQRK